MNDFDATLDGTTVNDLIDDDTQSDFQLRRVARKRVRALYEEACEALEDLVEQDEEDLEDAIEAYKADPEDDSKFKVFINIIRAKISLRVARRETKKVMRKWRRLELDFIYNVINNRNNV